MTKPFNTVFIDHLSKNIAHIAIISYLNSKVPLRNGFEIAVPKVKSCIEDLVSLASDTETIEWSLKEFSVELVKATLDSYLDLKGTTHVSQNSDRFKIATSNIITLFKQLAEGAFVSQIPLKDQCSFLGCNRSVTILVDNLGFCSTDYNKHFQTNAS